MCSYSNWYQRLAGRLTGTPYGYWVSPDGQLHQVLNDAGHRQVLKSLGIYSYQEAFEKGYIRIISSTESCGFENTDVNPTDAQISALSKVARSHCGTVYLEFPIYDGLVPALSVAAKLKPRSIFEPAVPPVNQPAIQEPKNELV